MSSFIVSYLKDWQEKLRPIETRSVFLRKFTRAIFIISLSIFVIFIFSQKTDLANSDLGRHLENGRLIWQEKQIFYQNFYSYTEPAHQFVNHHWLSGVIFYQIYRLGGFVALSLFNIVLALSIFWLFFYLAYKKSSFFIVAALSLPVILLMSERLEVRPEMFSVLLLGIVWLILEKQTIFFRKKLLFIFGLFALWSNLHIYFFLGLALIFFYALEPFLSALPNLSWFFRYKKISKKQLLLAWLQARPAFVVFGVAVIATIFNPNHIKGLFYPLNIFRQYGYEIVENKSIFFLQNLVLNYNFSIFKVLVFLLVLGLLVAWFFQREHNWKTWFFAFFVIGLGLMASRNLAIFGLVALVIISHSLYVPLNFLYQKLLPQFTKIFDKNKIIWLANLTLVCLVLLSLLFIYLDIKGRQLFLSSSRGWGIYTGSENAFNFFKTNKLQGPIFNNYDAGGALIFGLAGHEPVFVDNRPEAYSVDFLQNTYLPMQLEKTAWVDNWRKYGIKTIFFAHTDGTNWGQQFVVDRLHDPEWALVYFDAFYMILVDKSAYEVEFVEEYSLDVWALRQQIRTLSETSDLRLKFYLADFAQSAGQVDIAEEIYNKIILKYPNNLRAPLSLGQIYSNSNEVSDIYKAIDYLQQVINKQNNLPTVYGQLGLAYWRLANYRLAETAWREAPQKDKAAKEYLQQIKDLKKQGSLPR